jgi:tetratricopeptide (TPR) repeat protein
MCEEGTRDVNAFRLRSAVAKLGECLELDPSLAEASIARAMAFHRLGERENQKMEVARADSLVAGITDENRRMVAQLRLGNFGKSRFYAMRDSILTRLEKEDPKNIHVLIALATKAGMSDDEDAYEKAWLEILEVDPNYANSYNMLGYMELNRGNYDQAIEYMQKYAFLAPDLANPHDSLGEVYMVMGRYEEAEAEFRASVTMQPDFYHSLINLGKTYLARGQLKRGLDILEKVRVQVAGSDLEKRVDNEIVMTFLISGLDKELARMSAIFIDRYPDDGMSCLLRGVRLANMGQVAKGKAVMDSTLAAWRKGDEYQNYEKAQQSIDSAGYQFDALAAEAMDNPEAAAWNWQRAIDLNVESAKHDQWYLNYRLAANLMATGKVQEALHEIDLLLKMNPRLINVLVLKVKCHLELNEGDPARAALEQLQWSISKSDPDFPARQVAAELEARVSSLATSP